MMNRTFKVPCQSDKLALLNHPEFAEEVIRRAEKTISVLKKGAKD